MDENSISEGEREWEWSRQIKLDSNRIAQQLLRKSSTTSSIIFRLGFIQRDTTGFNLTLMNRSYEFRLENSEWESMGNAAVANETQREIQESSINWAAW